MKIKISEIPEEGVTLAERMDPAQLGLETAEVKFVTPLSVTATFQRQRDTVLVKVGATGGMELVCGRCLETFGRPYNGSFQLDYSTRGRMALDVTDDIRQEVFLSYPVQILCRQTCRGLCVRCGANLNEGDCGCSP